MATPVIMPRQGQSVETCLFSEWHVTKGSQVKKGDLLFSYETDKAAFEAEAPADGIILETFVSPGDVVPVLSNVAVIGQPGEKFDDVIHAGKDENITQNESTLPDEPESIKNSPQENKSEPGTDRIKHLSPRARKTASRLKVSSGGISGTGPGGRIIERDILSKAEKLPKATPLARAMAYSEQLNLPLSGSGKRGKIISADIKDMKHAPAAGEFTDIPLSNVRRIIARKMHESLQQTAQLTLHSSADARKIMELRKNIKATPDKPGSPDITLNDMVCFAVIKALKKHAGINAHFMGETIRQFHSVHLGIAVDTPRGLIVPTLQNAGNLDLENLSKNLKELAAKAQTGSIDPELLSGATFTVTNLGVIGVEMFTPVLNLPQVAILGINAIRYQPDNLGGGTIGFIPRIGLSLTFDHRAVDGAPAGRFLQEVINQIANFEYS